MSGLLLKDILVLRKAVKIYLAMLVFYLVLTISGAFDISMVTGFVALFIMMLPLSSFAYDELARWDKYAAALPAGRRGVVAAKYLLVFLLGAVAEVLIAVMAVILLLLKKTAPGETMLTGLACVGVGLLINSILLPLLFKFGAEKGRLFTMAVMAVAFLIGFGGAKLLGFSGQMPELPCPDLVFIAALLVVVALAVFVSYRISLGIYGNKDL